MFPWRGVYIISNNYPSKIAISANTHALARYSALVQEAGMVPIVEPEVLMDGNHSAEICLTKTSEVIKKCFEELILQKVDLKGVILKPNMILPGSKSDQKISNDEIAELTLKCLIDNVPTEVPGIAFLSGGQTEIEATKNLNSINYVIPTGNFGNVFAGFVSKCMGLPIRKLIVSSNKNDILTRFFSSGEMKKEKEENKKENEEQQQNPVQEDSRKNRKKRRRK